MFSQGRRNPHLASSKRNDPTCLKFRDCLVGVWRVLGNCLEGVWQVSGGCLEDVSRVCGRCLVIHEKSRNIKSIYTCILKQLSIHLGDRVKQLSYSLFVYFGKPTALE